MQFQSKPLQEKPSSLPGEFHFLVEPEPWLKIFLRNLRDVFRPAPPQVWLTSRPGEYWADALVHRPAPWMAIRQSFLLHTLFALSVYGLNVLWLARPRVIEIEVPRTTLTHYELSPYLPAISTEAKKPEPPKRQRAQKADPEYSQQEIVSLHVDHNSLRQTIVHPSPNLLHQDVPLPNLVASTTVPVAPIAARDQLQNMPTPETPTVVAPAQQAAERSVSRLIFPVLPQPEVVPPPSAAATVAHPVPVLPLSGPVVVPPSQTVAARAPRRLQLPPQSPDVVAPASAVASRRAMARAMPLAKPDVVPPAQSTSARNISAVNLPAPDQSVVAPAQRTSGRNLSSLALPAQGQAVVPPAQPVAAGAHPAQEQALGQLLALNVHPAAPASTVSVPEGNRRGEFATSPEGHVGATAAPGIKAGDSAKSARETSATAAPANVFVAPPPNKITAAAVVAAPAPPPKPATSLDRTDVPPDRIDRQVFGGRRNYAIRLSMPNLSSAMGSWIIRFAELRPDEAAQGELSTPEPIRKVDPAYPASMMHDRVEGVVVLHAVIRSDGSVDDVRVLEGFDERLDENARIALAQWRFRPGTRNGVPVDVEAVVRVPFRVAKPAF